MKSTTEYINLLRDYMTKNASKYSIIRMGIFGSVARGEQTEDSDVDVYLETSKPNMFALVHIKEDLQALFGCNVDIVRLRDHMDSFLRNRIEKEGIYVYKELLRSSLQKIEIAVGRILERSQTILSPDDFLNTPSGVERMESICMLLIAIGESVKRIDKETNKQLLSNYSEIDWKGVMGMRDIIAHHYFDIDAEVVFDVMKNNLPAVKEAIDKMISDL